MNVSMLFLLLLLDETTKILDLKAAANLIYFGLNL